MLALLDQKLLEQTLNDPKGRWILSPKHHSTHNEWALTALINNKATPVVIDRTFILLNEQLNKLFAAPDPEADLSLQIMTIHKAKGLEFVSCSVLRRSMRRK